jgi:hypothetical protein
MLSRVPIDRPLHRGTARFVLLLLCFLALRLAVPRALAAQVTATPATVAVSMNVTETLSIVASTNTLPAFVYGGATTDVKTFTVQTNWQLASGHAGGIHVVGWLSSTTAALTNGTSNIPASDFFLAFNAQALAACADPVDPIVPGMLAGASCHNGINIAVPPPYAGNETDTIKVQLQGLPSTLSAGLYNGTLNLAAAIN